MAGKDICFFRLNSSNIDSLFDEMNLANTTRVINSGVNVIRSCTRYFRFVLKKLYGSLQTAEGEIHELPGMDCRSIS